jgi:hypothetical protein
MPLEAALQFMGQSLEHRGVISRHGLNTWLRKRRAHDRYMRGLRTLRHFAAHVEIKPARAGVYVRAEKSVEVRPGWHRVTESTISHRWLLPQLTRADLAKLDTSELNFKALKAAKTSRAPKAPRALKDLRAWNKLVVIHDAGTILEHGLRQAQAILLAAERLL